MSSNNEQPERTLCNANEHGVVSSGQSTANGQVSAGYVANMAQAGFQAMQQHLDSQSYKPPPQKEKEKLTPPRQHDPRPRYAQGK
jgi:hypothetical protein